MAQQQYCSVCMETYVHRDKCPNSVKPLTPFTT